MRNGQAKSQELAPCGIVHDAYLQLPSQPSDCSIWSITSGRPSQLLISCASAWILIGSQIWHFTSREIN